MCGAYCRVNLCMTLFQYHKPYTVTSPLHKLHYDKGSNGGNIGLVTSEFFIH